MFFTAWELADLGHHVVCRDLDIDNPNLTDAFRDVGATFDESSIGHMSERLALVPDGMPIPFRPDFELIDTPPAKDGSMQGAARADGVVIPAEPELAAGRSLDKMLASIAALRTRQRDLQYLGVLPTRVRKRLSDHHRFIEIMRDIAAEYGFMESSSRSSCVRFRRTRRRSTRSPSMGRRVYRQYVIIAGNRRYHGAIAARLTEIPCVIRVKDADRAYVLNLVENLQRKELTGRERARAIARLATLQDDTGRPLGVREVARRTQFSVATISQWLNINKRPSLVRAVEDERLDIGRAMRLATLPDEMIDGLIPTIAEMPRGEVERFVAELRRAQDFRAQRAATLNVRHAMQAYRAVSLIDQADDDVRGALELTLRRIAELLGLTVPSVSLANTPESAS